MDIVCLFIIPSLQQSKGTVSFHSMVTKIIPVLRVQQLRASEVRVHILVASSQDTHDEQDRDDDEQDDAKDYSNNGSS